MSDTGNRNRNRNPDVPVGVPDPGTGGELDAANIEDSIRLPHVPEPAPGSFAAGLASALGLDKGTTEEMGREMREGASSATEKVKEGYDRVLATGSGILQNTGDATTSQPGPTESRAIDTISSASSRLAEGIQSVTPESVKKMEEKMGEKLHEAKEAMSTGARTGADVPMPGTGPGSDELSRQQAAARGGMD